MMDGIKFDIDKEAVEKAVVQAIVDSAIGDKMQQQIDLVLKEKGGRFNMDNLLEESIKAEIKRVIALVIRDQIEKKRDVIDTAIRPMLTDEVLRKMGGAALEVMLGELR